MICKCPECGKEFDILYPTIWVYKSQGFYYCTYKCIRKHDKRGDEDDLKRTKLTLEDKKGAVQIALTGGNYLDFLAKLGCKNPVQTWFSIKQTLKENDPETYSKLPKRCGGSPAKKTEPEKSPVRKPKGKTYTVRLDTEISDEVIKYISRPLPVYSVRSLVTGAFFNRDADGKYFRIYGDTTIKTREQAEAFSKEILSAFDQLGVGA